MKLFGLIIFLIVGVLYGGFARANDCDAANNAKIAQASVYCSAEAGGCSRGWGSECNGVSVGPHETMGGNWVKSDNTGCAHGDQWTGYYTELVDCSPVTAVLSESKSVSVDPIKKCASIVRVEDQSLGESIPLVGASFSMVYHSIFVKGREDFYKASVSLTDATLDSAISSFDVTVTPDGLPPTSQNYPNTLANQSISISWNGKSSSSLEVQGFKKYTVKTGVNYSNYTFTKSNVFILGGFRAKLLGLGGWAPSVLKYYDLVGNRMISMNGDYRQVVASAFTTGQVYVASEDGSEIYVFSSTTGQHLKTKTGITGSDKYTFSYNTAGELLSITEPFSRVTTFNRNVLGEFVSITAPKGQVTSVSLNANGYVHTITNPNSETFTMTYSGTSGLLSTFQKPGAQVSTFQYDADGKLTQDSHSGGYFFDLIANISNGYKYDISVVTSMGRATNYQTNDDGKAFDRRTTRPTGVVDLHSTSDWGTGSSENISKDGVNSTVWFANQSRFADMAKYETYNYVSDGSVKSRTINSTLTESMSGSGPFDINTLTHVQSVSGRNTQYTTVYDHSTKKFSTTSYMSRTAEVGVDAYERPISVKMGSLSSVNIAYTNENLTSITQGTRTTSFSYNPTSGFLETITDPSSNATSFVYNSSGRVASKILPDSRAIGFSYDANGNLTGLTPPLKPMHSFTYNSSELMSGYLPPVLSGVSNPNTSYAYNLDKQLTSVLRPDGRSVTYIYDLTTGKLDSFTNDVGTTQIGLNYQNDMPGSITAPDNTVMNFTYFGKQVMSVESYAPTGFIGSYSRTFLNGTFLVNSDNINYVSNISYDYNDDEDLTVAGDLSLTYNTPNGQLTGTSIGASPTQVADSYTYNNYGELDGYEAKYNGTTIYSFTLSRDATGRVNGKGQLLNGITDNFVYGFDVSGRLTQVTKNSSVISNYGYDSNSNRNSGNVGAQPTSASYDDQDRLNSYNTYSFTYTDNGEVASKTNSTTSSTTSYTYDVFGNLTSVTLPTADVITYEIDSLGRRTAKYLNGNFQARWVYVDQYRIAAETDSSNNVVKRFIYASKGNVPDYMVMGGENYRIITDHLGSPRLVVKVSDGSILQRMEHDEFGRVIVDTNPGATPFGFAGGQYESQTSLVHFGAREYDPELGRWITKDPILFYGGLANLYGYVANDPINFVDPSGLEYWEFDNLTRTLKLFDDDNKLIGRWPARSGSVPSYEPANPGEYRISRGPFNVSGDQRFCDPSGNCWFAGIESLVPNGRSRLGIHPDGGSPGTAGCVGAQQADTSSLREHVKRFKDAPVYVK